ncbi:MAG: FAD-binding oxidoreductase [Ktedonobacteraceae bacterium]
MGDGNFHTIIAAKPEDYEHVHTFSERLVRQALAWEGTASGEHGIGLLNRRFMVEEHGASVAWMHRLKALFDPDGLPWQTHLATMGLSQPRKNSCKVGASTSSAGPWL